MTWNLIEIDVSAQCSSKKLNLGCAVADCVFFVTRRLLIGFVGYLVRTHYTVATAVSWVR